MIKATNWAIAAGLLAVVLHGSSMADEASTESLSQPASSHVTALDYDAYFSYPSQDESSESPSDQPESAAADIGCAETCAGSCTPACCEEESCAACDPCGCDSGCGGGCCGLPQPYFLASRGIKIGGWMDVGIVALANDPADKFNGVVTFNDRNGEAQMNQLWFYLDREVDTGGYGWDIGGRVDFIYGTDAFFTQSIDGLEASWGQTERFYQAALPQFYVDVAYNDLTIRMGHFFTIIGYEVVQAPGNFFYTHAYTHQYGEPFTHTGMLGIYQLNDQLSVTAGLTRGWDNFDDTIGKDSLGFLGGVNWTSCNEAVELAFAISASEEGPLNVNRTMYSMIGILHLTDNLTYVIEHDYGQDVLPGVLMAEWYGLNQYFFYQINPCWAAGLRVEWFRDHDGTRVTGVRPTNTLAGASFPGNFYEITAGLNWKPRENLIIRPEVRWDWYEASGAVAPLPYDAGDQASQFLFAIDAIVTY